MIKVFYKSNFNKKLGSETENFLGFSSEIKNDELPIFELSWEFIFCLIKQKLRGKIYLIATTNKENVYLDFLKIKK